MHWLHEHPYRIATLVAILAAIGVAILVDQRSSVAPSRETLAWGGRNVPFSPGEYGEAAPERFSDEVIGSYIIASQLQSQAPFSYIPSLPFSQEGEAGGESEYDFEALVALLTNENAGTGGEADAPADTGFWGDAFSFLPRGLIATTTPEANKTALQKKLYSYGNKIGAEIQSFEDAWPNAVQILYDQAQYRDDPAKAAAAEAYARAFAEVGRRLLEVGDVPPEAKVLHANLAQSYQDAGKLLERIPKTRTEEEFLDAVLTYNASMDVLTDNFVNVALMFSAHGVVFREEDAGSAFTFRPVSF